jgi:hypothetical protein
MAEFLDALKLHNPEGQVVELTARLRYRSSEGRLLTVPAGFRTDLASVPAVLRWLAPSDWKTARSGALHDCGYRWFELWAIERHRMDRHLYDGLRADGVGWSRARGMQAVVWVAGWKAWNRWRETPEADKGVAPPSPEI